MSPPDKDAQQAIRQASELVGRPQSVDDHIFSRRVRFALTVVGLLALSALGTWVWNTAEKSLEEKLAKPKVETAATLSPTPVLPVFDPTRSATVRYLTALPGFDGPYIPVRRGFLNVPTSTPVSR